MYPIRLLIVLIALLLIPAGSLQGQNSNEIPALSDELQAAINAGGAPAVQQRFDEIWPAQKDNYSVDMNALTELMSQHISSGDTEMISVLSNITATVMQAQFQQMMNDSPMAAQMEAMRQQQQSAPQSAEVNSPDEKQQANSRQRGQPRQDLERFSGLYGNPEKPDSHRQLFVTETCDGYLLVGAMWGDVAPWEMTSVADNAFSYSDNFIALEIEFTAGNNGHSNTMRHSLEGLQSPLQYSGKLPQSFQSCTNLLR